MGRSGTTLLQNILNSHPEIVMPPESFFILHLGTKYGKVTQWNDSIIDAFIKDLYTDRPFKIFWQTPLEDVKESFKTCEKVKSFSEACNVVRRAFQRSYLLPNIKWVGDKNPIYCLYYEKLLKITPDAKVIHLVRDPRGTANGQINTFKRKNAFLVGIQWSNYNKSLLRIEKTHPNQYLRIRYEDIIENTDVEIGKICEFLKIDFSDQMLNYREKVVKKFEDYSDILNHRHQSLLKPIDKGIAEKWKKNLTQKQLSIIGFTTYQIANKLGYEIEKPTFNLVNWLAYSGSMIVAFIRLGTVKLYFSMPFPFRKIILAIRSSNSDHKYIKQKD